jgi:thioredoxin-like negative regulator of GroEL
MSIEELYDLSLQVVGNEHIVLVLGEISPALAARVLSETGVDVAGFQLIVDNYSIRHTVERHGDPAQEARQGQVAVEKKDFSLLLTILEEADTIWYSPRQKSPKSPLIETLIFEKQLEDFYYVLKEVRRVTKKGKSNRLALQTMYLTKKRRSF